MRIGIIIPDRGDRPDFLKHCLWLLSQQTMQPCEIALMNYPPESQQKDITQRYRRGYEKLSKLDLDIITFWENDDYYAPNYLETMVNKWIELGKPDLCGINQTIYYNLNVNAYMTMRHTQRSCAATTLIKPNLSFNWCPDYEPYTDTYLWMVTGLKGVTFTPPPNLFLSIKHGIGLTGGESHTTRLHRYKSEFNGTPDDNREFLKSVVDSKSFEFYHLLKALVNPH
jgi:hypothetical protein